MVGVTKYGQLRGFCSTCLRREGITFPPVPPPSPQLPPVEERVDHPRHYNTNPSGVECITVVEHFNFNRGNAIKYIWRAGEKGNELEDLKKSAWYIQREIARLEKKAST